MAEDKDESQEKTQEPTEHENDFSTKNNMDANKKICKKIFSCFDIS